MNWNVSLLQRFFPGIVFSTLSTGIHLTFDDGPNARTTPLLLDLLAKRNISATFFLTGINVKAHRELAKEIQVCGHQIGNHGFSHSMLILKPASIIQQEIQYTDNELMESGIKSPTLFRPPYGYFGPTLIQSLRQLKKKMVLWNIDSKDYRKSNYRQIENRIIPNISNGSIILLHDSDAASSFIQDGLSLMLDKLTDQGYKFLPATL